jgi:sulfate adenylyltransferase subunit 2
LGHEAVHILRETAAQFARDAILFSGGKDSLVLAALARKAVAAGMIP